MNQSLPMWVIYDRPKDYPRHFVVRRHLAGAGVVTADTDCQLADTLEEARKLIPPGLFNLGRSPHDEAQIVEVWV